MKASIAAQYGVDASAIDLNCGGGGRRRLQSGGLVIAFQQDLSAPEVSASTMQSISGKHPQCAAFLGVLLTFGRLIAKCGCFSGLGSAVAPITVFDCFGAVADASTLYPANDACGVCNGTNASCADCAG